MRDEMPSVGQITNDAAGYVCSHPICVANRGVAKRIHQRPGSAQESHTLRRFVECEPDVTRLRTTHEDSFVVMASDGLWDVISDQEAVTIVQVCSRCRFQSENQICCSPQTSNVSILISICAQECLAKSSLRGDSKAVLDARVKEAAEELMEHAGNKGSMDNITVLILLFQWH